MTSNVAHEYKDQKGENWENLQAWDGRKKMNEGFNPTFLFQKEAKWAFVSTRQDISQWMLISLDFQNWQAFK